MIPLTLSQRPHGSPSVEVALIPVMFCFANVKVIVSRCSYDLVLDTDGIRIAFWYFGAMVSVANWLAMEVGSSHELSAKSGLPWTGICGVVCYTGSAFDIFVDGIMDGHVPD